MPINTERTVLQININLKIYISIFQNKAANSVFSQPHFLTLFFKT